MRERLMPMPVGVTPDLVTVVLVVFIVVVLMLVIHYLVRMQMLVSFGQMQPYTHAHQHRRGNKSE